MKIKLLVPAIIEIPAELMPACIADYHEFWDDESTHERKIGILDIIHAAQRLDQTIEVEVSDDVDDFCIKDDDELTEAEWIQWEDDDTI